MSVFMWMYLAVLITCACGCIRASTADQVLFRGISTVLLWMALFWFVL